MSELQNRQELEDLLYRQRMREFIRQAMLQETAVIAELETIEARLGTAAEQAGDEKRVADLVHNLKSIALVINFREEV